METKANYVLIGFFTLAVLAGAFSFVHWFRTIGRVTQRANYHVVFQGPVGGLRTGASVLFNGMRVGEVSNLELAKHDPREVMATIAIDANVPVRKDTAVTLDFQGLTGIASIGLKGGDLTAGPLPEGDDGVPVLVAGTAATQDLSTAVREVLHKMDDVLSENRETIHTSLTNLEDFTAVLKNNTQRIEQILGGIETITGTADKPGELTETTRAIRATFDDVDKKTLKYLDGLIGDARRTLSTVDQAVKNFDRNPSRIIFGGGTPAPEAARPATTSTVRRPAQPQ